MSKAKKKGNSHAGKEQIGNGLIIALSSRSGIHLLIMGEKQFSVFSESVSFAQRQESLMPASQARKGAELGTERNTLKLPFFALCFPCTAAPQFRFFKLLPKLNKWGLVFFLIKMMLNKESLSLSL